MNILELLEFLKTRVEAAKHQHNFLCNEVEHWTNYNLLDFKKYLVENYPKTCATKKKDFIKQNYDGVVFNTDKVRLNWLNRQIEIETNKLK